jgi:hypothetical protein
VHGVTLYVGVKLKGFEPRLNRGLHGREIIPECLKRSRGRYIGSRLPLTTSVLKVCGEVLFKGVVRAELHGINCSFQFCVQGYQNSYIIHRSAQWREDADHSLVSQLTISSIRLFGPALVATVYD